MRLVRGNLSPAQRIMVPASLGFGLLMFVRTTLGAESTVGVSDILPLGAYAAGFGTASLLMLLGMVRQNVDRYQLGVTLLSVTCGVWALALVVHRIVSTLNGMHPWTDVFNVFWAWPIYAGLAAYSVSRSLESARRP